MTLRKLVKDHQRSHVIHPYELHVNTLVENIAGCFIRVHTHRGYVRDKKKHTQVTCSKACELQRSMTHV